MKNQDDRSGDPDVNVWAREKPAASSDVDHPAKIQATWMFELDRRWQEIECGVVIGEPAESVFAELRKKYPS